MDSILVVKILENKLATTIDGYSLTKQNHQLMKYHEEVLAIHAYREANKCVGALANEGTSSGRDKSFLEEVLDFFIKSLFDDDVKGVLSPR